MAFIFKKIAKQLIIVVKFAMTWQICNLNQGVKLNIFK